MQMHYPQRRRWFRLRARRCVCGLAWPCPDVRLQRVQKRFAPQDRNGTWTAQTAVYPQVGRAGLLTPGQAFRAQGGAQ
jgi:hypothetical protein